MLKIFFGLRRKPLISGIVKTDSVSSITTGYHAPLSATDLLATPQRQQWLQTLWDYSSLPKEMYQCYYRVPLEHCVTIMQQFPATESGHHACLGGLVDHLLETVAYAARLSKNYLLPAGAEPEEQASQSTAWNAVIVYAAMMQSLERLCHIEVESESGQRWMPLRAMPDESYRFRFKPVVDAMQVQSLGAMLAWKVIPDEALIWLSSWPEVLKALSLYLTGFRHESGIINAIVSEAIRTSVGKMGTVVVADPLLTPLTETTLLNFSTHRESLPSQAPSAPSVGNLTSVNLMSSLDNAMSGSVPGEINAKPGHQEDDVMGDLLAVMGFSDGINSCNELIQASTAVEDITHSAPVDIGERFWQWLSEGCCTGIFAVNTANARIHIIAGYVFIRTPHIFHQFLSENRENSANKNNLQHAFEQLGRHRQDNGVMYTCHVYEERAREGRFQKMTGYLVIARKLYKGHNIPVDNPLLIIKHQGKQGIME